MLEYAKLVLAVDSAQARTAKKDLDSLTEAGGKAEKSAKGMQGAFSALKGALAAIGAGAIVRGIVQQADAYALTEGRLRLVTRSTEELTKVQENLFGVAQDTRTEYQATAELYTRLARSTGDVVRQQSQLIDLTRLVNQSFQVSGASAQEAAGGVMQFGQALQSGVLQGDELRAIRENAPRLFDAIVEGIQKVDPALGLTRQNFKDLASEGEITTNRIVSGLLSQKDVIEREFAQLPRTVGGALTQLKNEFFRGIGQSDTSPIVSAIDDLRQKMADPEFQRSLVDTASGIAELTAAMVKLASLGAEPFREFHSLGTNLGYIAAKVTGNVTQLDLLEHEIQDVDRALKNSFLGKPTKYLFTPEEELRQIRAGLEFGRNILLNGGKPAPRPGAPDGATGGGGTGGNSGNTGSNRGQRTTEVQRLIESMRQELLLGGEINRLEQTRISLREGFYGKYSREEEKTLERLAHELDVKEKLAQADEERRDLEAQRLSLIEQTYTPLERYQRQLSELNRLRQEMGAETGTGIDDRTYNRRVTQLQQEFDAATRVEEKIGQVHGLFSETVLDMEAMARRGAENIQDSLADFLFDPFDRGLKGMVQGFADTMRRMAAQAAAQELMGSIMNLGMGFLQGSSFGLPGLDTPIAAGPGLPIPGKASGGLFGPGWTMVGEQGPELVHFNGSGRVYNNGETAAMQGSMGGGVSVSVGNITIHAPDPETGRKTAGQAGAEIGRSIQVAMRRNG